MCISCSGAKGHSDSAPPSLQVHMDPRVPLMMAPFLDLGMNSNSCCPRRFSLNHRAVRPCVVNTRTKCAHTEFVVAIDLGTSATAYSWKSASDPNPSVGVPDMAPNEDIVGKSPTTLLIGGSTGGDKGFRPSGTLAYGRVAQRRYAETDIPPGAQLFKRFKMVSSQIL